MSTRRVTLSGVQIIDQHCFSDCLTAIAFYRGYCVDPFQNRQSGRVSQCVPKCVLNGGAMSLVAVGGAGNLPAAALVTSNGRRRVRGDRCVLANRGIAVAV